MWMNLYIKVGKYATDYTNLHRLIHTDFFLIHKYQFAKKSVLICAICGKNTAKQYLKNNLRHPWQQSGLLFLKRIPRHPLCWL